MPDFLTSVFTNATAVDPVSVIIRLVAALALGFAVSLIYRRTRAEHEITVSFGTTLVLLAVLIAMVTQIIGDNVARAFSLVGALSIVRFRTVVRDTQDTAFVIFSVAVGMAVGASNLWVALGGLVVIGAAAWLMKPKARTTRDHRGDPFRLTVRTTVGLDLHPILNAADAFLVERALARIGTARQGLSVEASYRVYLRADRAADELINTLNSLDGVQGVELAHHNEVED